MILILISKKASNNASYVIYRVLPLRLLPHRLAGAFFFCVKVKICQGKLIVKGGCILFPISQIDKDYHLTNTTAEKVRTREPLKIETSIPLSRHNRELV